MHSIILVLTSLASGLARVKMAPPALQWTTSVLAGVSQWHGTSKGVSAVLLNATEDVQARISTTVTPVKHFVEMLQKSGCVLTTSLKGVTAIADGAAQWWCTLHFLVFAGVLTIVSSIHWQAADNTVSVVETIELDPKRARTKHKNPADKSWQQCERLSHRRSSGAHHVPLSAALLGARCPWCL